MHPRVIGYIGADYKEFNNLEDARNNIIFRGFTALIKLLSTQPKIKLYSCLKENIMPL